MGSDIPGQQKTNSWDTAKEAILLKSTGPVDGKERTSVLGRIFGTTLHLFDGLKVWNPGNVSLSKEKPQKSKVIKY